MAKYTHTFWPHYWGISEDDSLMGSSQVLYSENMDLTSNSKSVNLTRKSTSYLSWTSYEIVSMFDGEAWMLVCDQDENLYRNWNATPVWTAERIVWYWEAQWYLYMIDTAEDIYRILLTNTTQSDWTSYITLTESWLPTSQVSNFQIIALEDITYIGYDKYLYIIDNSSWTIDATDTYEFLSSDLAWMTIVSNTIKLYQSDGRLLLWQWISYDSVTEIVDLWVPINSVYQIANTDYAISAGRLYTISWYTLQNLIYGYYSDELNSEKIEISRSTIYDSWQVLTYLNWIFYIAWWDPGLNLWDDTTTYWGVSILTYWKKKNQLPNALNVFNTEASTWNKYEEIFWVMAVQWASSFNDVVYVAYEDSLWNYGVDKITVSDGDYQPNNDVEWIIIYENYNWWITNEEKIETKITIRADLKTDDEIDLMYIDSTKDGDDNMISILTVTWPWNIFERSINSRFIDKTFLLRFRQNSTLSKKDSLKYYTLTLNYETVEDQND